MNRQNHLLKRGYSVYEFYSTDINLKFENEKYEKRKNRQIWDRLGTSCPPGN